MNDDAASGIRNVYIIGKGGDPSHAAEFDRLLAEHDRAVAEKAWDDAVLSVYKRVRDLPAWVDKESHKSGFDIGDDARVDVLGHIAFTDNPHKPLSVSTSKDADA